MNPRLPPELRAHWILHSDHLAARAERLRLGRTLAVLAGTLPKEEQRRTAVHAAIQTGHHESLDVESRREYDNYMTGMKAMARSRQK